MSLALLVAAAAALGAAARYAADLAVQRRLPSVLPWGTFVVNVTGSFVLGVVTGLANHHGLGARWVAVIGTGLLGGYTTWSTFAWESFALAEQRRLGAALLNVAGSLAVGLTAAAAGLLLARL
ncbi:MAG TPA: fluoride efflux transporter CrcB [Mycobacteriales bacterium]|nr:fluoride efflux transporter CrcB [Mycobacteriales bacterium]